MQTNPSSTPGLVRHHSLRRLTLRTSALLSCVFLVAACSGGKPDTGDSEHAKGGRTSKGGSSGTNNRGGAGGGIIIGGAPSEGGASNGGDSSAVVSAVCGDGVRTGQEACDDKNRDPGDGCAADCSAVEEGFVCPEAGKACIPGQVCSDKKITGTENCDDGNSASNDGCSSNCRIESGWSCPRVGAACVAAACGDSILAGAETCDDGQAEPKDGDGCSAQCVLESPGPDDTNAWMCPEVGKPCVRTKCGNSTKEGSEQCDDGNNNTGDGCSPACRQEPRCPKEGGACKSACGDGMILTSDTDQECDDGNSISGDGCSSECKKEPGYACTDEAPKLDSLKLPIVLRDFRACGGKDKDGNCTAENGHPDFETYLGSGQKGIVQTMLDADGKPQHVLKTMSKTANTYSNGQLQGEDYFASWYRDNAKYNKTIIQTLQLDDDLSPGEFRYDNQKFFPLTGLGWGDTNMWDGDGPSTPENFHFTSEVRYWFEYQGGETLQFLGDDDVWVFVNRQLAVDLGGVHTSLNGSIVLDDAGGGTVCENAALDEDGICPVNNRRHVDLGMTKGSVYEIVVFQAERHTVLSNYILTLSSFNSKRSVCKPVCGDGFVTPDEACDLGKDKNTGDYNTCNADCTAPRSCGDSHVDADDGEECDDGLNLAVYGYNNTPACGPGCKWTHVCGDGKVDSLFGEQCDDGNHVNGDGCESNCTNRVDCGNGTKETGEMCDDGNRRSGDGCSEFCTVEGPLL